MPRPIVLFSGALADLPLAELAAKAAEWGYGGLELAARGDHLNVRAALTDPDDCANKLALLSRYDLQAPALANFGVGQAIGDVIDQRHRAVVPEHVWGDGQPAGVRQRAIEELVATIRVAQRLGAAVVVGFTGSPLWSFCANYPGVVSDAIDAAYADFAETWHPILDACQECGVRFALEVHPGQMAFDYYSTERTLAALDRRAEFGLCVDPSHLQWQGLDPAAFVREFGDRVYHVHMKDVQIQLDGRTGLLNSFLPYGDARRGWEYRGPGRGGINWDAFIRALNSIDYDGPLSVDWRDEGMEREFGLQDALRFVQQLDFPGRRAVDRAAFR